MTRRDPNAGELQQLVTTLITEWVNQLEEFTAYAATIELRDQNPDIEIAHDYVRFLVNDLMTPRLGSIYDVEVRHYGGAVATTFVPMTNVVNSPIPPQLPSISIFDWDEEED